MSCSTAFLFSALLIKDSSELSQPIDKTTASWNHLPWWINFLSYSLSFYNPPKHLTTCWVFICGLRFLKFLSSSVSLTGSNAEYLSALHLALPPLSLSPLWCFLWVFESEQMQQMMQLLSWLCTKCISFALDGCTKF